MRNALDRKGYFDFYREISYKYPDLNDITLKSWSGGLRINAILDLLASYAEKGCLLLDAGCGGGVITIPYCQAGGRSVALDLGPGFVEFAKREAQNHKIDHKAQFVIGDVCALSFKEQVFDIIVCAEVIEHLLEPSEAIKEFERLLKPNGILIITVPNALAISYSFLRNIKVFVSIIIKRVIGKRVENIKVPEDLSKEYDIYKHRDYAPSELKAIIPENFKILQSKTIVSPFSKIFKNEWLLKLIEHIPFLNMMGLYSLIVARLSSNTNNDLDS